MVRKMRASVLVLGPMLARMGDATVSLPGGCAIGDRPIDLHLKVLECMGAEIELAAGYVRASAPKGRLPGGDFSFPVVSVGAAGITGGAIDLIGARPDDMQATLNALAHAGLMIEFHNRGIKVSADGGLKPLALSTAPFPGFATDMQAQFMAMLCRAEGDSFLEETIFENRYMHVPELRRMGAEVDIHGRSAIVHGTEKLAGANVMATDLRASMSLVLAGLAAEGETEVLRVYHLDRGYERLEEKLSAVGATIERRSSG